MDVISQEMIKFRLKFHWGLFPRFELKYASIDSDNGLALNRCQAIIWTNDVLRCWCIYASLGLNELMGKLWGVNFEDFHENWLRYNSTALYMVRVCFCKFSIRGYSTLLAKLRILLGNFLYTFWALSFCIHILSLTNKKPMQGMFMYTQCSWNMLYPIFCLLWYGYIYCDNDTLSLIFLLWVSHFHPWLFQVYQIKIFTNFGPVMLWLATMWCLFGIFCRNLGPIQYHIRRLIIRSHKVSNNEIGYQNACTASKLTDALISAKFRSNW